MGWGHLGSRPNMSAFPAPLELKNVKVFPLAQRQSLSSLEKILVDPEAAAPPVDERAAEALGLCLDSIKAARERGRSVILMYGAHLIKNGAMAIVNRLVSEGWITHLATNGAGTIHDWEFSFQGRSEESVRNNVATGSFGTWDETGRYIHLALLAGGLRGEGYGRSLGRFIAENGTTLPASAELAQLIRDEPAHPLTSARADLLQAMQLHQIPSGRIEVKHPWNEASILATAFKKNVPFTAHPGIGYDIFSTHPMFNGSVIGRAGGLDFALFGRAVEGLEGGVALSVGSAIMAPQVFEKSLSCVNNLRLQAGRKIVQGHSIFVVDVQDGGRWDWSQGEPPKSNPAYYLRFCKSFARMGGTMHYVQADNAAFLHHLLMKLQDHR